MLTLAGFLESYAAKVPDCEFHPATVCGKLTAIIMVFHSRCDALAEILVDLIPIVDFIASDNQLD
jgi:hypothetical protein